MRSENRVNKNLLIPLSLVLISIVLIKLASFYPLWIHEYYSHGVYPVISIFFRKVFGWLPFSLGDILYAAAGVYLLIGTIRLVKKAVKKADKKLIDKKSLVKTFFVLSAIYILFNIFWGLNYNRPGIAFELIQNRDDYSGDDLKNIAGRLLIKVNENRRALGDEKIIYKPYEQIFNEAHDAFKTSAVKYPSLNYEVRSVKKSMFGRLGNFLGFLGYYNPFTGEAQVNLTQPRFLIPFVTCHEMAHQLGYASESEANFVGYLAAVNSRDIVFHYSAYFDLFNYANRELFYVDSIAAKNNYTSLDSLVKKDEQELREYWRKSDNLIEPIISAFYDRYLKANQQSKGVRSYNEVVGWLIAYYKQYGHI